MVTPVDVWYQIGSKLIGNLLFECILWIFASLHIQNGQKTVKNGQKVQKWSKNAKLCEKIDVEHGI